MEALIARYIRTHKLVRQIKPAAYRARNIVSFHAHAYLGRDMRNAYRYAPVIRVAYYTVILLLRRRRRRRIPVAAISTITAALNREYKPVADTRLPVETLAVLLDRRIRRIIARLCRARIPSPCGLIRRHFEVITHPWNLHCRPS